MESNSTAFLIKKNCATALAGHRAAILFNRNLEIITYDSKDNHRELHDALEELVPMVEDERSRIAKEMDW